MCKLATGSLQRALERCKLSPWNLQKPLLVMLRGPGVTICSGTSIGMFLTMTTRLPCVDAHLPKRPGGMREAIELKLKIKFIEIE